MSYMVNRGLGVALVMLCGAVTTHTHAEDAGSAASGSEVSEVSEADVFRQIADFVDLVEQVRFHTGTAQPLSRKVRIRSTAPRHLYYQAQTLFRKSNQLAREWAGAVRRRPAPAPEGDIESADVVRLLRDAGSQMDLVRVAIGIEGSAPKKTSVPRRSGDAMAMLLETNRQLNLMGVGRSSLADSFDQLLLASTYLAGVDPDTAYPPLPRYQAGRLPADLYDQITECMHAVSKIAREHGTVALDMDVSDILYVGTNDVYDLATILLADVAYLTWRMEAADVDPMEIVLPPRVFPSHANQIAELIELQLLQIM